MIFMHNIDIYGLKKTLDILLEKISQCKTRRKAVTFKFFLFFIRNIILIDALFLFFNPRNLSQRYNIRIAFNVILILFPVEYPLCISSTTSVLCVYVCVLPKACTTFLKHSFSYYKIRTEELENSLHLR